MRRVLVTGIGVVSALGMDRQAFWQGLMMGATGIRASEAPDAEAMQVEARVPAFDSRDYVNDERVTRVCHRPMELLCIAANAAVADADLARDLDSSRTGTAIGLGAIDQYTDDCAAYMATATAGGEAWRRLHPLRRLRHLPNIPAAVLSMRYGAAGPSVTFVSGITAGLQAVLEGFHMIRDGRADAVVCGGTDSQFSMGLRPRIAIHHECSSSRDPETACRPFDRRHAGIVPGEGAAVFVLEAFDRCERRGATAHAEILGGAAEASPARGVSVALEHVIAQLAARHPRPDAVIAHGDGSVCSDLVEASAFTTAPYLSEVGAITSIQAAVGHTFGAAGALSAAAGCVSLCAGELPPIRNLCDPVAPAPFVTRRARPDPPARVMAGVLDPRGLAAAILLGNAPC